MITESLEEYKEICSRIASTHESVTKYSTTLILVSSAIFVGTLRLGEPVLASGAPIVSIALITIANVTLLIQSTINYKCRSHNRLVAYRNLIAAETYDTKTSESSVGAGIFQHAVSFDVCMDLLNKIREEKRINFEELGIVGDVFAKKGVFANIGGNTIHPELGRELTATDLFCFRAFNKDTKFCVKTKDESGGQSGTGQKTSSANNEATLHPWFWEENKGEWEKLKWHDHKVKRGLGSYLVLAKMIFGFYDRSPTWEYPDYINRMITSIVAIELLAFLYLTMTEVVKPLMCEIGAFACEPTVNFNISSLVAILIAAALLFLFATYQLMRLSIAWQKLMVGNHRVFSFFIRFIPVRLSLFKQMFPDRIPYYLGTAWDFTDLDKKNS